MKVDLFDFVLPEHLIALRPADPRDSARMMVVRPGEEREIADAGVSDLAAQLAPGDVLVVNDTRVIPARLSGRRVGRGETEPRIEVTLHKRVDGETWLAFAKPARKLEPGDRLSLGRGSAETCLLAELGARVTGKHEGGEIALAFDLTGPALDEAIALHGEMPLPPYIAGKRPTDERDAQDYQTLFAREAGAVAAPTAALHFTPRMLETLEKRGIGLERVTLHVGAGTFLPMKAEDTSEHRMHAEWGTIPQKVADRLNAAKARGGRVVAVGTTAMRVLETAAADGAIRAWSGDTSIFITPGYRFRAVDALMTNFHLPKSTLFMLVCAFSGFERMQRAYAHAIAVGYRFYSYGDSCLLFPDRQQG